MTWSAETPPAEQREGAEEDEEKEKSSIDVIQQMPLGGFIGKTSEPAGNSVLCGRGGVVRLKLQMLVHLGADLQAKDLKGETPLQRATVANQSKVE